MQNENIKTDDENTFTEIASIMSEIDTADTQLNALCLTKELTTHHCSNFNAIAESFDRLFSSSITSFENRERRSVHTNVHNERTSVIVKSVSTIVIRSLVIKQHQDSDDSAEIEKQK